MMCFAIELMLIRETSIEDAFLKASALGTIAWAQAEAGLLDDALNTAERIDDARDKAWALGNIAEAQAKAGLVDDALKTAARIE